MYRPIDIETWDRREIFEHFSRMKLPHYTVAVSIDATPLITFAKENGVSFYLSLIYLAMQVLNGIENFRLRIVEGKVVLYDETYPSFTFMRQGQTLFQIYTCAIEGSLTKFATKASEAISHQQTFFGGLCEQFGLVYLSCLPWVETSVITNEGMDDADDAIPRLNWGKYAMHDGRLTLNMSLTVNHRFIDGYHIGQFFQRLQERIDSVNQ